MKGPRTILGELELGSQFVAVGADVIILARESEKLVARFKGKHHRRKVDEEHSGEISGNQNRIYFWKISYEKQIAHPGHVDCGNHRRFRFDLRTSRDGHFV